MNDKKCQSYLQGGTHYVRKTENWIPRIFSQRSKVVLLVLATMQMEISEDIILSAKMYPAQQLVQKQ